MRGTLSIPLTGPCLLKLPAKKGMMHVLEGGDRAGSIKYSPEQEGFVLARKAAFRYLALRG